MDFPNTILHYTGYFAASTRQGNHCCRKYQRSHTLDTYLTRFSWILSTEYCTDSRACVVNNRIFVRIRHPPSLSQQCSCSHYLAVSFCHVPPHFSRATQRSCLIRRPLLINIDISAILSAVCRLERIWQSQ
jgi:hypothetical protein